MTGLIFISYARRNPDQAKRIDDDLQAVGFKTWRDVRNLAPHQDFTAEIERAIEASEQVVCCITSDVRRNDSFVRRELAYALALKKPIVPLIFDDTLPPIHIINLTRISFKDILWDIAFEELKERLARPVEDESIQQTTPPDDPYYDYLNALHQELNNQLEARTFALLTLHSQASPEQVNRLDTSSEQRSTILPISMMGEGLFGNKEQAQPETPSQQEFKDFNTAFKHYNKRVLLLGEPGAGKTVTLLAFARDAVVDRLADPSQPLPIFALIATWDSQEQPLLADWLGKQILELGADEIADLLRVNQALLLLDGLDELGTQREEERILSSGEKIKEHYDPRPRFISMLDASWNLTPNHAIVTCRVEDYKQLGSKLTLDGAVILRQLNDNQMREYLREMPALLEALDNDTQLQELLRTPLILSLFTYAYSQATPEELEQLRKIDNNLDLRDKVFETFIKKGYEREKSKPNSYIPFSLEELRKLISSLAVKNLRFIRSTENFFTLEDIVNVVKTTRFHDFIDICKRLHILTKVEENTWRFVHLRLRDYFAFTLLLIDLSNNDPQVRKNAASALSRLPRDLRAVEPLIAALNDSNADVRRNAAHALGRNMRDRRSIEPLILLLNDIDTEVRRSAAIALRNVRDQRIIDPLITLLNDSNQYVRSSAAAALANQRDTRLFDPLITALSDSEPRVRSNAIYALGNLNDKRAVEPLIKLLHDQDVDVRYSCARVLSRIGDARAVEALKVLLGDHSTTRISRRTVAQTAADALEIIATPEALTAVKVWRENPEFFRKIFQQSGIG